MPFTLRIVQAPETRRVGQQIVLSGPSTIGRDAACAVVLDDATVSRRHASIDAVGSVFTLRDLDSGNGVFVDEARVREVVLGPGQTFRVGATVFECVAEGAPAVAENDRTVVLPRPVLGGPPNLVATAVERIVLRAVRGGGREPGVEVTIDAASGTVGRAVDNALVINERDVSRKHAELRLIAGGLLVTDLGSAGGTWVGSRQVSAEVVRAGGRFRFGTNIEFEFVGAPDQPAAPAAPAPSAAPSATRAPVAAAPAPAAPAIASPPAEAASLDTAAPARVTPSAPVAPATASPPPPPAAAPVRPPAPA